MWRNYSIIAPRRSTGVLGVCWLGRAVRSGCWFAFQRAATVGVTVLAFLGGRLLRPRGRSAYYTPSGRGPVESAAPRKVPLGYDPDRGRAWHPREFGAVLVVSASLTLPAPPLSSSSRRYAPQCFVGEYISSPCDVSHRASEEPRRCMSLSSALAPSSLASPSMRRVFLRSFCARRRPVSSLNLVRVSPGAKRSRRRRAQCGVQIRRDFVRTVISFHHFPALLRTNFW